MGSTGGVETGVCMFAYNNEEIDYARLAIIAALHIKANMKHNEVALICDKATAGHIEWNFDKKLIDTVFDYIIIDKSNKLL